MRASNFIPMRVCNHFISLKLFNSKVNSFRSVTVCVIGSGPAGFYCTQHLLKLLPTSSIDIYEKLPVPFGLVRFGVAPDHADVKNVINNFTKIGSDSRVKFIGNVSLGKDFKLQHLQEAYNIIILCYGADQDIELKIPGEKLNNVIPARKFIGWYNGLPHDQDIPINLDVENVNIFGHGNVAIDVARILLKSVDDLRKTDITENSLSRLAESKVKTVRIIGRRGPLQVAFTIKEFREILKLPNVQTIINPELFENTESILPDLPRPRKRLTELLFTTTRKSQTTAQSDKKLFIEFFRSPTKFTGINAVNGVELVINKLKNLHDISPELQQIEATCQKEYVPCELIFRSIGYKSSKVDQEIPFYSSNYIGKLRVLPGVYSAGWLSTGSTGVILSTMSNAFKTAYEICEDIKNGIINDKEDKPGYNYIKKILKKEGKITVDWQGWKNIDKVEIERGKYRNKPREKIVNVSEMLEIGGRAE
ncbi:hypothetical protein PGB90_007801 [Kerria lacca]